MLLVLALVTSTCATAEQVVGVEQNGLALRLESLKPDYRAGDRPGFRLHLANTTDRPLTLEFRNAQRFDVTVRDASGREVWRWSAGQMFAQVIGEVVLPPRGERTWTVTAPASLPPGRYAATAVVTATNAKIQATISVTVR